MKNLVLALILGLGLAACGQNNAPRTVETSEGIEVVHIGSIASSEIETVEIEEIGLDGIRVKDINETISRFDIQTFRSDSDSEVSASEKSNISFAVFVINAHLIESMNVEQIEGALKVEFFSAEASLGSLEMPNSSEATKFTYVITL